MLAFSLSVFIGSSVAVGSGGREYSKSIRKRLIVVIFFRNIAAA